MWLQFLSTNLTASKDRDGVNRITDSEEFFCLSQGIAKMNHTIAERRSTKRHSLRIPMHFRVRGSNGPEVRAESIDLSERGALLEMDVILELGSVVDLQLQLPEEITGQPTTEWRCGGRVVHVAPAGLLSRLARVGVQFNGFDVSRLRTV